MKDWVELRSFMKIFCLLRELDFGSPTCQNLRQIRTVTLQATSALAISGSVTKHNLLQLLLVTATEANGRTTTFPERRYYNLLTHFTTRLSIKICLLQIPGTNDNATINTQKSKSQNMHMSTKSASSGPLLQRESFL